MLKIVVIGLIFLNLFIWYKIFEKDLTGGKVLGFTISEAKNELASKNTGLEKAVLSVLEGNSGSYAVSIKNLKTSQEFNLKQDQEFESGSLYKLWVMAVVFEKIKTGELKEDQLLGQDIATLNRKFGIDLEFAELKEGYIDMTVSEALKQMVTISHNYAALLLSEKIKNSSVNKFLQDNGLSESSVSDSDEPPKTTASDTALFLEKLYKGEIVDSEYSAKMIEFLKGQKLNDKLPKYLPPETVVAHKTGEIGWFSHDGGIVFSSGGDYIIVVMSESENPAGAEDRIGQISKAVYDYFSK